MPSIAQCGRIDRIEVSNFKSYKGEQIIGPFRNFTAIIGPNGAGKSNLMDAISFVLGVRSAQLRGDKLRDLVYANNDSDSDVERDSRRAHVMLVFAKESGEELRLARGITVAGASEYRINGRVVSWDDYNSQLKAIGILVKARNFLVFQGDVESIASKNPRELAGLFEQISGSDEFRKDYERLAEEKAHAEEQVAFSFQKKKNMTSEKKQKKEQKDEAEHHIALQQELKEKRKENYLWQLFLNEHDMKEGQKAKAGAEEALRKAEGDLEQVEASSNEHTRAKAAADRERQNWERKVQKKEHELEKERPKVDKVKETLKRQEKKRKSSEKALLEKQQQKDKQVEEVGRLQHQLTEVQAQLDEMGTQADPTQGAGLGEELLNLYHEKKAEVATKTNKLRSEIKELNRQQQTDSDARQQLEGNRGQMDTREQQLREAVAEGESALQKIKDDLKAAEKKLIDQSKELKQVEDTNRAYNHRKGKLEADLEKVEAQLREARADRTESEREQKMAEAVASMKRLFPGRVHGRLSELVKTTQRKYQLAVAVAMGKHFDAVAVEDEATGKECIQYLKDNRIQPMMFIPLATVRVKPVQARLRVLGGTSKPIIDVLMFSDSVKTAVLYAVSNTLVCDGIDEAKALAYGAERHKVVTLDGTLLTKNGNMTGGTSGSIEEKARRLQNIDQNVHEMKEKKESLLAELQALGSPAAGQEKERNVRSSNEGLRTRIAYAQQEQRGIQAKLQQRRDDLTALEAEKLRMGPRLAELEGAMSSREGEIGAKEQRLHLIADKVFKEFCRQAGVANIREYEDEPLKQAQQAAEHRLALQTQVSKLRNQIDYEQKRDLQQPIDALRQALTDLETEIQQTQEQREALQGRVDALEQELAEFQEKVNDSRERLKQAMETAEEGDTQKKAMLAAKGKALKAVTAKESVLVQLHARRKEIVEACEMEQIEIRTSEGEAVPMEIDSGGAVPEAAVAENLDYSALPRSHLQATSKQAREKLAEEIRLRLEELGKETERTAPNLKAIEQYEAIKEKERLASDEFETIRKRSKEAAEKFLEVKENRTERFMKAFDHISNTIDRIYKDLTASRSHPLGGSAYLSLESEEEPFLHGIKFTAMPPTKRFRDMEQLSGGEKTVAALALLFSIHSFKPSPFFVLDEVDAALDNLNVAKVAAYIRSKSRDSAIHGTDDNADSAKDARSQGASEEYQVAGFQSVVISLKDQFFDKADALVGVYRDTNVKSSRVLTLDLNRFDTPAA